AEWLRSGLQSRLHRFDSGRRLGGAQALVASSARTTRGRTPEPRAKRSKGLRDGSTPLESARVSQPSAGPERGNRSRCVPAPSDRAERLIKTTPSRTQRKRHYQGSITGM